MDIYRHRYIVYLKFKISNCKILKFTNFRSLGLTLRLKVKRRREGGDAENVVMKKLILCNRSYTVGRYLFLFGVLSELEDRTCLRNFIML
jgi:hypothetical protein